MTTTLNHGRRRAWLPAAVVFGIALAVRLAHFLAARHAIILEPRGTMDEFFFNASAQIINGGDLLLRGEFNDVWPAGVPFFLPPLFSYFLGLVHLIFGQGNFAPFLIQSVLGSLAAALVCRTAQMIAADDDHRTGLIAGLSAGLLLAADGLAVMYSSTYLAASLDPLLASLAFHLVVKADRNSGKGAACCAPTIKTRDWALAGAALGLFALNRPNALLLLPFAGTLPFLRRPLAINRRAISLAAALVIAALAVIAPATLRNAIVSHRLVPISSHGGLNFYIGNWSGASGAYAAPDWLAPDVRGQIFGAREWLSEEKLHRPVDSGEVSGLLYQMALREMADDPGRWLRLAAAKAQLLLSGREAGLNLSLDYMREAFSPALWAAPFGMWCLVPLGLAGAVVCRKRRGALVVGGLAAVFGFSVWLFFVADRYRLPLHPPLAVLAGCGIAEAWTLLKRWREKREQSDRHALMLYFGVLAAAAVVAALPVGVPSGDGQMRLEHALRLIQAGDIAGAEGVAAGMPPDAMNPFFWRRKLARAYRAKGALVSAESEYRKLLSLEPAQQDIACELAGMLAKDGRTEAAKILCPKPTP